MSLEYCSKCGKEFLTEADEYMVTPKDNYALTCYRCIGKHAVSKKYRVIQSSPFRYIFVDHVFDNKNDAVKEYERCLKKYPVSEYGGYISVEEFEEIMIVKEEP